jgi:anti-sigma B factor antagonist
MKTEIINEQVICYPEGRLDTLVALEMEKEVDGVTDKEKKLIFDFEKVDYISSSFLRICLKKVKELGKENFSIINPSPDIKKVFKIAGLENLVK